MITYILFFWMLKQSAKLLETFMLFMHNSKQIFTKNIHPLSAVIYVRKSHIFHACMFKMVSETTEDLDLQDREGEG